MANLCIKTPSSAIQVLKFQLLVLRPRPSAHITRRKMLLVLCVFSSTAIVQLCRFVLLFKRNCHPKGVWSSISQENTNVKILNQGQDARSV